MSTEEEKPIERVSIFDICETDSDAEENGRWFTDIMNDGNGLDIKLRKGTSKASVAARRRLDRAYKKYLKNGQYPDDIGVKVLCEQFAEGVIVAWRGVYGKAGEEIPYSKEMALVFMNKFTSFRDTVVMLATSLDSFRIEDKDETSKN